jgi:hypothetical protein
MKRLLALFLLVASVAVASAQPAPRPAQPAQQQAAPDRREKVKQRIRALRAYTLTEQLSLDEATAAKLFPALSKFDDEFDKLLLARTDLQKKLAAAGAIKDSKVVDKLIDDAIANQKALWDTEARRLGELRKILTPAQTAKLLVVLPAMERKLQNQLRRAALKKAGAQADDDGDFDKDEGDLGKNPYGTSRQEKREERRQQRRQERQEQRQQGTAPCDPFSDRHGCAK